jgi:branched-chain amino acid transport system permease protein
MDVALTILADGIIYGAWLFLVAIGLTLVFGVMKILNVAHGALYAIGAYAAATIVNSEILGSIEGFAVLLLMLVGAVIAALALGPLLERALLRLFYERDEIVLLLVTFGLSLILEDIIKLVWGVYSYYVPGPYSLFGHIEVGPLFYVGYDFFIVGLAIFVGLATFAILNRTNIGKAVQSVIHDEEISRAMGINVAKVYLGAFTFGVFLATLAGAFTAPMIAITPSIGVNAIILSFAVVVIGGLGSIGGAAIGAIVVGLSRAAAINLWPEAELFVIYAVMSLVLLVRPEGLFGQIQQRKI